MDFIILTEVLHKVPEPLIKEWINNEYFPVWFDSIIQRVGD